jgi:hypothetical protein
VKYAKETTSKFEPSVMIHCRPSNIIYEVPEGNASTAILQLHYRNNSSSFCADVGDSHPNILPLPPAPPCILAKKNVLQPRSAPIHKPRLPAIRLQGVCTPLHIASRHGKAEAVSTLIAAQADVEAKDKVRGAGYWSGGSGGGGMRVSREDVATSICFDDFNGRPNLRRCDERGRVRRYVMAIHGWG